jgi:hypothetical protein
VCAQAQALLQARQIEAARALLVDLVSTHPNHAEGWLLLATVVDADRAVDCLERVLALEPGHARARKWLARAQGEQARLSTRKTQPYAAEAEVPLNEPGDEARSVRRLGQYLLEFKFVSADQLRAALAEQRRAQPAGAARRVGELLLEQGALTEDRLNFALREQSRELFSYYED